MISIIIPTHNEEDTIADTLKCLEKLTGDFEVIIVDAESDDHTPTEIEQCKIYCPYPMTLLTAKKKGRAFQMNHGAQPARGDVLLFLHAVTLLPPNALQLISDNVKKGYSGGAFRLQFDNNHWAYKSIALYGRFRSALLKTYHGDQAIFVTKQVFEDLGGYDTVPIMEDTNTDVCFRIGY